jgi:hypothetical protein
MLQAPANSLFFSFSVGRREESTVQREGSERPNALGGAAEEKGATKLGT